MAACAIAKRLKTQTAVRHIGCLGIDVALKAQKSPFCPQFKMRRNGSMGAMADRATLNAQRWMFVYPRPTFLRVAAEACLEFGRSQLVAVQRAVRVMTISTLHEPFRHAMVIGQSKLSLNRAVAGEAEVRLPCFEKAFVEPPRFFLQNRNLKEVLLRWSQPALGFFDRCHKEVSGMTLLTRDTYERVL